MGTTNLRAGWLRHNRCGANCRLLTFGTRAKARVSFWRENCILHLEHASNHAKPPPIHDGVDGDDGPLSFGARVFAEQTSRLPQPNQSGIEYVVVVTMENRSFDHFFGWWPSANGKQAGLSIEVD